MTMFVQVVKSGMLRPSIRGHEVKKTCPCSFLHLDLGDIWELHVVLLHPVKYRYICARLCVHSMSFSTQEGEIEKTYRSRIV
jgi:hypothetical protein